MKKIRKFLKVKLNIKQMKMKSKIWKPKTKEIQKKSKISTRLKRIKKISILNIFKNSEKICKNNWMKLWLRKMLF